MSSIYGSESITEGGSTRDPLHGRVIIVTGCGSGIGKEVALELARRNVRLALTDSDGEEGRRTCQEVREIAPKGDVVFAILDIKNDEGVAKLCKTFLGTYKKIHGLVNCAGINPYSQSIHESTMPFCRTLMATNFQGTHSWCTQFIKTLMTPNNTLQFEAPIGGFSIVNIGSAENSTGLISQAIYKASKGAVIEYSKSLAKEYADRNIRCNVVSPGHIETQLTVDLYESTEVSNSEMVELVPMKRMGEAVEVALVVVFLLSPDSSYITGVNLPVDGGSSI